MRILHILDHSLPLQSGYVYRTLGIVNQQRAMGWEPLLLTSGKHYAPGPARERIGGWEFLRTPRPTGLCGEAPVAARAEDRQRSRAAARRCDRRGAAADPSCPFARPQRVVGASRRPPACNSYGLRGARPLGGCGGKPRRQAAEAGLRYRATRLVERHALRRADAVTTICEGLRARGDRPRRAERQGHRHPQCRGPQHFSRTRHAPDRALTTSTGSLRKDRPRLFWLVLFL